MFTLLLVCAFFHASTKVSCVGFNKDSLPHVVCFVFDQSIAASDNRLSYACILLFPTGTKVSRGVPDFNVISYSELYVKNNILTLYARSSIII